MFRQSVARESLFAALRSELRSAVDDHPLNPFLDFSDDGEELKVYLYPGEEPVFVSYKGSAPGNGPKRRQAPQLVLSARTSSAGPGYHAWLVDLIELVSARLNLDWQWADADGDIGDETGFTRSATSPPSKLLIFVGFEVYRAT